MNKLRAFSTQATPVFTDFRIGAPAIARATEALGPFAHAATPALTSLGDAAQQSQQPIVQSDPILRKVRDLAQKAGPGATSLAKLLSSLRKTGGYKKLTSFLYNSVGSINGFDQFGHILRAQPPDHGVYDPRRVRPSSAARRAGARARHPPRRRRRLRPESWGRGISEPCRSRAIRRSSRGPGRPRRRHGGPRGPGGARPPRYEPRPRSARRATCSTR